MKLNIEDVGLTNSMRFVDSQGVVDIKKAYSFYMPSEETMRNNLEYFLKHPDDEMFQHCLQTYCEKYFTLYQQFKNKP
jgi:hypothetical protein